MGEGMASNILTIPSHACTRWSLMRRTSGLYPVQLNLEARDCFKLGSERLPFWVGESFLQSRFHGSKTLPFALQDAGIYIMRPTEGAVVPFGRKSVLFLDCVCFVVDPLNLTPLAGTNFAKV